MKHQTQFILLIIISSACIAASQSPKTEIKVFEPSDLRNKYNGIQNKSLAVANFGEVHWGRTLVGLVYLGSPFDGCSPLQPLKLQHDNEQRDMEDPEQPIVLLGRGGCFFEVKARNAQQIGAKAVIIVDSQDENLTDFLPLGNARDDTIHIPTVIIDMKSGNLIKEKLVEKSNLPVSIGISFHVPKVPKDVTVDIWTTSSDLYGFDLIRESFNIKVKFGDLVKFVPHALVWYCRPCAEKNFVNTTTDVNCVSSGRHCSPDPDGAGPLTGSAILIENLRQLCVYEKSENAWWDYFIAFNRSCVGTKDLESCSYQAIKDIGVSVDGITKCVRDSFGGGPVESAENSFFQRENDLIFKKRIQTWPTIFINGQMYRGDLHPVDDIFDAICDGFENPPDICSGRVEDVEKARKDVEQTWLIITGVVLIISVIFVIIFVLYKRAIRREVNQEMELMISSSMQKYMALREEK